METGTADSITREIPKEKATCSKPTRKDFKEFGLSKRGGGSQNVRKESRNRME